MPSAREHIAELGLLVFILILAVWLRFGHLDKIEFIWDQAEISKWAIALAREGHFDWIGPLSSTKLDSFAVTNWILALPYALSLSPIFATGYIALLNVLAVLGCYLLTRLWFGRLAACVAALLFAVAPWAVIYSRKIWQVELLAPFTLLFVWTGWRVFIKRGRWVLLAYGLCLALLAQIHFSALAFIPLGGLWALCFWRRLDWRLMLAAGLLAASTFAPYFVTDARREWRNVHRFTELMEQPASVDADAFYATWVISTGMDLHWVTGPDRYPEFVAATPNWRWVFSLAGALAFGAGGLALGVVFRELRRNGARQGLSDHAAILLMLTTWLVMPALFQTRHGVPIAPHYFTTVFPVPFMLVGWLVAQTRRLPERFGVSVHRLLLVLVGVIAVVQTYEITALLRFVETHDTRRGYGTPVSYSVQAARTATRLGREMGSAEVILLSEGDEPRMYEMPAVADVLLYAYPHRATDIRTALIFPATPVVYWATFDMSPGETLLATFTDELTEERIPLREGLRSYRFYRWPGGRPTLPALNSIEPSPTWANGVRLIGYVVEGEAQPGAVLNWTLVWQPTRTPTEDTYYHWFNHLTSAAGEFQSQQDGPSVLPAYWRAGDTILNWFQIPIPADAQSGAYTLRVGMYAYPTLQNVSVLDETGGQTVGEWIELGPIIVTP
jgi:4-amino-4-deoxy-L-arabinose transferase-like glycosyltransferase